MYLKVFFLIIYNVAQIINARGAKQNILLIVVDDLRTSLGCYGDHLAHTPNIDSLAQRSILFTRAYTQQALCGPSRTSLLTSRSPHHLHQYDVHQYWRQSAGNFTSLPQFFKENGYHTMSIGKVFHPGKCSNFNDDQPFSWSQQPFHPSTERYKNNPVCPDVSSGSPSRSIVCPVNVRDQPGHTLPDLESLRAAQEYLEGRHKISDQPFFLAVGFHKPHIPLKFPKEYLKYHPLDKISLPLMRSRPPNLPTIAWNPWLDMRQRDDIRILNITFPWERMADEWAVKVKQSYYAAVSYVDDLIGQLLKKLDDIGQRDNTIILLTSDHGWSIAEHGEWSKYSNYEVSTHVPFILSIPGRTSGHNDHLVELLDVFPTLRDLSGIDKEIPKCENGFSEILCTDGRSLEGIMNVGDFKKTKWRNGAFSQYPRPDVYPTQRPDSDQPRLRDIKFMGYSVRTVHHRYTEWVSFDVNRLAPNWSHVVGCELYDHLIDPGETLNLCGRKSLDHIIESLSKMLYLRWST
ncbi:hypothetical protein ONE63_005567 [Megalurothrips usitatus]|uniref:Sulfatase N-terminal domain-containing protein n=1 Tax=Megalurothrips usitatus TaxID=439358 RepID=A0AAV7Y004_9NEOP|nr:hypothetical protein ONE63_005567 [Megalurothrips usitatus]